MGGGWLAEGVGYRIEGTDGERGVRANPGFMRLETSKVLEAS